MLYFVFGQVLSFLFDLFTTTHSPDHHKDIQILLLRQQVRILQRKQAHQEPANYLALRRTVGCHSRC
jgi:hypothetical protein